MHALAGGAAHTSGADEQPAAGSHDPVRHASAGTHEVVLSCKHESRPKWPHWIHVSPLQLFALHSSVHELLHAPPVQVSPVGQLVGGPQDRHPLGSKWPHVAVPLP
jgi:hypothetical protein